MTTEKPSSHKSLVALPRHVGGVLETLDPTDEHDRKMVLAAIEELTDKYVVPNMKLARRSQEGVVVFDLATSAGVEIPGFVRGAIFDPRFEDLEQPPDEKLMQAFEAMNLKLGVAECRNFFSVWLATRALLSLGNLLRFLGSAPPGSPELRESELARLGRLGRMYLPYALLDHISLIIETISPPAEEET